MKKLLKILRYIFITLLVIIVIALGYFYYDFNYSPIEDEYEINETNLSYFKNSYDEARQNFIEMSNVIISKFPEAKLFNIKVDSKIDTNLTTDICFIPGDSTVNKLLIISSGIHGVEGYAGSAIQLFFMDKYLNKELLSKISVLLIHSLNPYGYKYNRRVSENNVDLNRNSDIDKELYLTKNEGYPKVYDLINPMGKVDYGSLGNQFFFVKAIAEIAKASMPVLRQAVLQGQYEFPKGLYFGGNDFEPQIKKLAPIIDSICKPYRSILALDLHTGYGARGVLHLFPNPAEAPVKKRIEKIFEGFQIDWGDQKDFYTVTGDFVGYIGKINMEKEFIPMTFEYGTMNTQTTMGSLKSIHIMISENQGQQYGFESEEDKDKVKKDLLEMYYPSSNKWRSHIIEETRTVFDKSLLRFAEY